MSNLAYETARAVEDVMCGVVTVTVSTGYPLVEADAVSFVGITFEDSGGETLTIALRDEQAGKLLSELKTACDKRTDRDR